MRFLDKKILTIIALNTVIVASAAVLITKSISAGRPEPTLPEVPEDEVQNTGGPISLSIPKINLNSDIEYVGKAQSGNMAVPRGYDTVGWYKHGAVPGDVGNAVFAGHLDRGGGKPAVFARLNELSIGDTMQVTLEGGEVVEFRIVAMKLIPYDSGPQVDIFGPTDERRLNLITCDGTWIPEQKTYSDRLVVFAERID